jgi:uncharacterized protein (DUF433 family)
MKPSNSSNRISMNPDVMLGKPVVRGTRIPVYLIVELVDAGLSPEAIVEDYPDLTIADIEAAVSFAKHERERTEVRAL